MITLSNGYSFDFSCGSGALAFDGRGWFWEWPLRWMRILRPEELCIVAKTVTAAPKKGNLSLLRPWQCVRLIPGGACNCVGLTNPGVRAWATQDYPRAIRAGYTIAASVKADTVKQAIAIERNLDGLGIPFVEVNVSCPNVDHGNDSAVDILRALRNDRSRFPVPLILKLSLDQVDAEFIRKTTPLVDVFHAINTVPWEALYPGRRSPIEGYAHGRKGGVSGRPIHALAVAAVRRLRAMTGKPIIGGGGISTLADVDDFERAGASAFSIGTLFLRKPWMPNRIVRQYRASKEPSS